METTDEQRTQADEAVDDEEEGDIAAWARPAYAAAYSEYLGLGAPYGHTDEGMRRWMSEQIEQQRRKARQRDGR